MENFSDEEMIQRAIDFARLNKIKISKEIFEKGTYVPVDRPVSIFMAGAPGAGKTEFSKTFVSIIANTVLQPPIRIDPDEYRELIPGYTGHNSYLFQAASSIIAEKMHDIALQKKLSFIFDSTFSNQKKAMQNIERSLKRARDIIIVYVYQEPVISWQLTKIREQVEKRHVPKEVFINTFLESKQCVNFIKSTFGSAIQLWFVEKNIHAADSDFRFYIDIQNVDRYVNIEYDKRTLQQIIH